ncbi:hypothetical protein IFM51744_10670 [Aspergillus udagawae]|nr:hypothetical protein IFM51744_10670 [Aspergillus udagawae]
MVPPSFVRYCRRNSYFFRAGRAAHSPFDPCHVGNECSAPFSSHPFIRRPRLAQTASRFHQLRSSRARTNPTGSHETVSAASLPSLMHSPHAVSSRGKATRRPVGNGPRFCAGALQLNGGSVPSSSVLGRKPVRQ